MLKSYTRLAVLQLLLIILFLSVAKWLPQGRLSSPSLLHEFRLFGWLLLILPLAWWFWAQHHARSEAATLRTGSLVFIAGLGLTLALMVLGSVTIALALQG